MVVYPPYRCETAVLFAVNDSVPCRGIAIRSESVIDFNTAGTLNFRVNDGDKVATDSIVADVFLSKTVARDVKLRTVLMNEYYAFSNAAKASHYVVPNLDLMSDQIHRLMINLSQSIDEDSFSSFAENRLASLEALSIFASATGTDLMLDSNISHLLEEIEAIDTKMLTKSGVIRASEGGYFASFTDGLEDIYCNDNNVYMRHDDADDLLTRTPLGLADIEKLITSGVNNPNNNSCKVILDYTWHFAALVDSKFAQRFFVSQALSLDLNYALVKGLPVTIEAVAGAEDSEYAMILFSCEYLNSDLTGLRIEEGEISFRNYRGIRIPRSAIRVIDGKVGVFTKYDSKVMFKKIDYIYETDEYILAVPSEKGDELKLYDEIILEGKDLYDGKSLA